MRQRLVTEILVRRLILGILIPPTYKRSSSAQNSLPTCLILFKSGFGDVQLTLTEYLCIRSLEPAAVMF